jgi:hypothetical protein
MRKLFYMEPLIGQRPALFESTGLLSQWDEVKLTTFWGTVLCASFDDIHPTVTSASFASAETKTSRDLGLKNQWHESNTLGFPNLGFSTPHLDTTPSNQLRKTRPGGFFTSDATKRLFLKTFTDLNRISFFQERGDPRTTPGSTPKLQRTFSVACIRDHSRRSKPGTQFGCESKQTVQRFFREVLIP